MIRIIIKPAKRWFSPRQQWTFELRAANGARLDPRDTVYNRAELITALAKVGSLTEPMELVILDRFGVVEERWRLR